MIGMSRVDPDLIGISGNSADDVWVLADGAILRWDGHSWAVRKSEKLHALWRSSTGEVWGVGGSYPVGGKVLRYRP